MKPLWIAATVAGIAAVGIASLSVHLPDTVEAQAALVPVPHAGEEVIAAPVPLVEQVGEQAEQAAAVPLQRVDANSCVAARWESRYRNLAYDHIVTLENGCATPVDCEIMTLDEASVFVRLLSRTTKEVAFRQGSRERQLNAWMQCTR